MSDGQQFDGNRLPEEGEDLFGFAAAADRIAEALTGQTGSECFVLGLEGEWGSGKSSLLAMIQRRLERRKVPVRRFEPWTVGSRDALIAELLTVIDAMVEGMGGETASAARKVISDRLKRYSGRVAMLGRAAKFAKFLSVPGAGEVGAALDDAAGAMKDGLGDQPLAKLKGETSEALAGLGERIVVLIDDIDRLEPREAVEVLRLVQSAADFPFVSYVLCYDQKRLHDSITSVIGLTDGTTYLEKFIQVVYPVPQPQPAALRELFLRRLRSITGREQTDNRLAAVVVDHVGHSVRTPRAVIRALDGLRLVWGALEDEVELADLVWLQFTRTRDAGLYRWMESYVAEATDPPMEDDRLDLVRKRLAASVGDLVGPASPSGLTWRDIHARLPLAAASGTDQGPGLLIRPGRAEALDAYRNKRLSSPEHARLYFGLLRPEGAMSDRELEELLSRCRTPPLAAARMLELATTPSRVGVSRLEIVLEQLGAASRRMNDEQVEGFVVGLLQVVDRISADPTIADKAVFRQTVSRLLTGMAEDRNPEAWSRWVRAGLEDADATVFLSEEAGVEKGQVVLAWAGGAQEDVARHLALKYDAMDPATLLSAGNAYGMIDIWRAGHPAGVTTFLDTVLRDDDLLGSFVTPPYRRALERMGTHLGKAIFHDAMSRYFDLSKLRMRLEELDADAETRTSTLREILLSLRAMQEETDGDQDDRSHDSRDRGSDGASDTASAGSAARLDVRRRPSLRFPPDEDAATSARGEQRPRAANVDGSEHRIGPADYVRARRSSSRSRLGDASTRDRDPGFGDRQIGGVA